MKKRYEQDHDVKYWLGLPYRWNWPSSLKVLVWNKNESRIFPPKQFGVGWGINLHALVKKLKKK